MQKKIMLAVDDSAHSKQAINYAVTMSSAVKDLHYVIFNVQPMISSYLQDEAVKNMKAKAELDKLHKKNVEKANALLNGYKDQMVSMSVETDRIETITTPSTHGLAKDMLGFAQTKGYDAIVIGRRGLSKIQEKLMGSVTVELVEHSRVIPVWIIDGLVVSNNILVAVDGSESSLRALDHVSFMVSDNENTHLTLFHVKTGGGNFGQTALEEGSSEELEKIISRGNEKSVHEFHARGIQILKNAGIGEDRYEIQMVEKVRNVGKAVIEKAEKEDFGTIVVGRSGASKSFFMGSVSRYIINNTANRALWVVS